jgi:peptidoglycan/LPS O-acetylase OafA/YrhL
VLDGLRGIAVLLVILMHTGILLNGYVGVDLFFGLSGFLITTLLYEEWERTGTISFARFYERRARRLLPALLMLLVGLAVVDVVCYPLVGWSLGKKTLTTLLFVNNWVAGLGNSKALGALTPTWSLAQEEQFYLLWPLVLALMLRKHLRPGAVVALLAGTIAVALWISPHLVTSVHGYNRYFSPVDRAAELLFGCAAAIVWRSRLIPNPAEWRALPSRARGVVRTLAPWCREIFAWVLVVLFVRLLLHDPTAPMTPSVYLGAIALGVPLMVTMVGAQGGLLPRLLAIAPLRYVGKISYALYLIHLTVRNVVYHYLPGDSLALNAALTIAISLALASVSWRLVESRILARGRVAAAPDHRQATPPAPSRTPTPRQRPASSAPSRARSGSRSPTPEAAR